MLQLKGMYLNSSLPTTGCTIQVKQSLVVNLQQMRAASEASSLWQKKKTQRGGKRVAAWMPRTREMRPTYYRKVQATGDTDLLIDRIFA